MPPPLLSRPRPPLKMPMRMPMSAITAMAPTASTASVVTAMSRLRMWAISWASTPRSSRLDMMASNPVVTVMAACFGLRPVAKALGARSSTTKTLGIGMPEAIDICSTRARSSANSGPSAGRACTMVSAAVDDASQAKSRYPMITSATMASTVGRSW